MKNVITAIFIQLLCNAVYAVGNTDTFSIYFQLNNPQLDKPEKAKLDSLLYYDKINSSQYILIVGYADYLGSTELNDTLSQNRAKNVMRYLSEMSVKPERIKLVIGKGEVNRNKKIIGGYPIDRRVDIVTSQTKTKEFKAPATVATLKKEKPVITNTTELKYTPVGQTFVLNNIYFYPGRHKVREESYSEMENLFEVLDENQNIKIAIEGHICCVRNAPDALDEDNYEIALSVNRAKYIYNYLITRGIERDRLKYAGFGRSKPLRMEKTVEDENMNRRVEIRILER